MAKPRKPKNNDDSSKPPDDYGAVTVRHQKLCLSIDLDKRIIYGYTELEITVPDIGIVGLHAENLGIESVFVDGEVTEFEYYPRQQNVVESENERRWSWVTNTSSAADAAGSAYVSALERELVPNLLINCCPKPTFRVSNEMPHEEQLQEQYDRLDDGSGSGGDNGIGSGGGTEANVCYKQNVKSVRINYWVEKAEAGIHFDGNVLHTDNQIRRARCWFPCIDEGSQRCCFDLEFTVAHHLVAVSTGNLLYQVLSKDDPPRKTYVYRLDIPVTVQCISLVVAPLEVVPDPNVGFVSHMCLPPYLSKLRNTVEFFHNAFNYYEEYLDAKFPFGSYTQVFLAPEMAVSSSSLGASISIFSAQVLYDERVIDQAIDTSIKLAFALAKQWFGVYIVPEEPNDEWLLDGLAGFLTDVFVKKFLGNNEARYRRYKANCAVCKADDSGATALSSSTSCKDLYGTHCFGIYGKIRSWKSVAILQMLEKQMGPESFRKILQKVISRARDASPVRSLSTKEFRHFSTKMGNLERPFLKEFFPRWVGSCGCPMLRMGFSYNKRKNLVELAVLRECTAVPDGSTPAINLDSDNRDGDIGWPGMMSIRVYELDGMYDHPILPLAGEMWQLLEIQCHSKLGARRFQKSKKGSKADGSDENVDAFVAADIRASLESPLLWLRADPEMEYLAEIQFNQPVQMWINQLEKDEDVVAQAQAIAALEALPELPFSVVNALNNFLSDSKAFWRVRIEAAFALANTASEDTDWSGLLHLVKFYKSRRFDGTMGLPKPNDFHDFPEYFVLEAIPQAVAMVRAADRKSPREAIEFVLQLLKYNDNTGNPYSDVFWLASLVQSVGQLEFGQQSVILLSSLLKRIDRHLQFDRLMPSYNGILTISCIRALVQIALKLSGNVHLEHVFELIKPFQDLKTMWQIRIEASRALLDLEFHCRGIDAALSLFMIYLKEEPSLRGQAKLAAHAMRLCQIRDASDSKDDIKSTTLVDLLNLLEGHSAFNNVHLRHYLFCILHILAGRMPTLYGVPRDQRMRIGDAEIFSEPKNIFTGLLPVTNALEPPVDISKLHLDTVPFPQAPKEADAVLSNHLQNIDSIFIDDDTRLPDTISKSYEQITASNNQVQKATSDIQEQKTASINQEQPTTSFNYQQPTTSFNHEQPTTSFNREQQTVSINHEQMTTSFKYEQPTSPVNHDYKMGSNSHEQNTFSNNFDQRTVLNSLGLKIVSNNHEQRVESTMPEPSNEPDTISVNQEHRKSLKIKVKRSAASTRAEEADNLTVEKSRGGHNETVRRPSSSVSVDAPQRNSAEAVSTSNQNIEEVNSTLDRGSRMTASIGSAKPASDGENFGKDLQCTADSSKVFVHPQHEDLSLPRDMQDNNADDGIQKFASLQTLSVGGSSGAVISPSQTKEHKKKDEKKKRKKEERKVHKDDPEYLERKRLKKEKKRKEKEMAKLLSEEAKAPSSSTEPKVKKQEPTVKLLSAASVQLKPSESSGSKMVSTNVETKPEASESNAAVVVPKFRIKIKSRTLTKS